MLFTVRKNSLLTGRDTLEQLFALKDFPVYIGCTEQENTKDLRADMIFDICKETGFIQLRNLLPLDVVYGQYHSEAVGGVWQAHHQEFAEFITSYQPQSVLEIGGSNGNLAKIAKATLPGLKWTIIEPTPSIGSGNEVTVINGFFDEKFIPDQKIDAVVNSHVLEHLYDPETIIKHINQILPLGGKFIFSIPNLYQWLSKKFPNTLNFEHTLFLTESVLDYLLDKHGFIILKKQYFQEHSIFYVAEKTDKILSPRPPGDYQDNKQLYLNFIKYYQDEVSSLNDKIKNFEGEIYLFGAHIFSQFLLEFGLKTENIKGILDNSRIKQGKRLYGSDLKVFNPEIVKDKKLVAVVLRAGTYNDEIRKQLLTLNNSLVVW